MGSVISDEIVIDSNKINKFLLDFNSEESKLIRIYNKNWIEKEIDRNIKKLDELHDLIIFTRLLYYYNDYLEYKTIIDNFHNKYNIEKGKLREFLKDLSERRMILDNIVNEYEGMYELNINDKKLCSCCASKLVNIILIYAQLNYFVLPKDIINYIKYWLSYLIFVKIDNINYEGVVNIIKIIRHGTINKV